MDRIGHLHVCRERLQLVPNLFLSVEHIHVPLDLGLKVPSESVPLNLFYRLESSHHDKVVLVAIDERENEHVAELLGETDFKHGPTVELDVVPFDIVKYIITITPSSEDIKIVVIMRREASACIDPLQIHRSHYLPISLLKAVPLNMVEGLFFQIEPAYHVNMNVDLL